MFLCLAYLAPCPVQAEDQPPGKLKKFEDAIQKGEDQGGNRNPSMEVHPPIGGAKEPPVQNPEEAAEILKESVLLLVPSGSNGKVTNYSAVGAMYVAPNIDGYSVEDGVEGKWVGLDLDFLQLEEGGTGSRLSFLATDVQLLITSGDGVWISLLGGVREVIGTASHGAGDVGARAALRPFGPLILEGLVRGSAYGPLVMTEARARGGLAWGWGGFLVGFRGYFIEGENLTGPEAVLFVRM